MKFKATLIFVFQLLIFYQANAQWVLDSNGIGNRTVFSFAASGSNLFAGTSLGWGVYMSTNNGANWTQSGLTGQDVNSLVFSGSNLFAGTLSGGVYLSTNNGTSWTSTGLSGNNIHSILVSGTNIFAGTFTGVYLSTNNGTNWTQTSLNNRVVYSLIISGINIFAGTQGFGVYLSTNNGANWTQTSLNNHDVHSLAISGNNIFAGTQGAGVFLSTNNGTTWSQTSLNTQDSWSLAASGNNVFAGIINSPLFYVSNNNGINWTVRNEGLANNAYLWALYISNNYLFAGTEISVYSRQISEIIGIRPISNELPNNFSLSQNFPNPFNPTTKIKFSLPKSSYAKLVIYDALGRELETIVNEQLNTGTYEAEWNADKYSSGIYYYKLIAGDFNETKKMILIK